MPATATQHLRPQPGPIRARTTGAPRFTGLLLGPAFALALALGACSQAGPPQPRASATCTPDPCPPAGSASAPAPAVTDPLPELAQRELIQGPDRVNLYLVDEAPALLAKLNTRTADCDTEAVNLSVRLTRSRRADAVASHRNALRIAGGVCPDVVLATATPQEIPQFCASASGWTPTQTARELRRRMAQLDADPALRNTSAARACRAAYDHELRNTRVTLQAAPGRAPVKP